VRATTSRTVTGVSVTRPVDIPNTPGVYEFSDATGRVLYVGKAVHLSQRLNQYFPGDPSTLHPRTRRMLLNATAVRWVVCASETEALVLEREWVHEKQPPYNVRLRTGNGYGGIAVTRGEIPRLITWRGKRPGDATTYGPYPGTSTHDLLDALMIVFGVRTCDDTTYRQAAAQNRPCLLGETGKCLAPCTGAVEPDTHRQAVDAMRQNLERPDPAVAQRLEAEMQTFSRDQNFEAAARRRDQLAAFRTIGRRQRVVGEPVDVDAVAVARSGERIAVSRVRVRGGIVTEADQYAAVDDPGLDDTELLTTVLGLLPPAAVDLIATWDAPPARAARGDAERAILAFAQAQAEESLVSTSLQRDDPAELAAVGAIIAELIGTDKPVRRIECTDISHTGGRHTVGSVVVLVDGVPRPDLYRRLNIGELNGDDYAATRMLVTRRLRPNGMGHDQLPDLLLVDGGPGQVAAAVAGRADAALEKTATWDPGTVYIMGLAKRFEELWPEGATVPLRPEPSSALSLLLRHARDEAHRHALGGNRRQRERAAVRTGLEDVPGLGPVRRKALLEHFGTLDAIAAAPETELAAVPGIGPALAGRIRNVFQIGLASPSMTAPTDGSQSNP
jgi:excinuclease ABC subunit C